MGSSWSETSLTWIMMFPPFGDDDDDDYDADDADDDDVDDDDPRLISSY